MHPHLTFANQSKCTVIEIMISVSKLHIMSWKRRVKALSAYARIPDLHLYNYSIFPNLLVYTKVFIINLIIRSFCFASLSATSNASAVMVFSFILLRSIADIFK